MILSAIFYGSYFIFILITVYNNLCLQTLWWIPSPKILTVCVGGIGIPRLLNDLTINTYIIWTCRHNKDYLSYLYILLFLVYECKLAFWLYSSFSLELSQLLDFPFLYFTGYFCFASKVPIDWSSALYILWILLTLVMTTTTMMIIVIISGKKFIVK